MPSFQDFLGEYSKSRGVTESDKEEYSQRMGPPMDKAYPKEGKPIKMSPRSYYKAAPSPGRKQGD